MSKDFGNESIESISGGNNGGGSGSVGGEQVQVNVDDASAPVTYSSTVRVTGSPEELILDFAGPIRQTGPRSAQLKIDHRIVLNPWAAKRLAMALNQAIARHEQTYGPLELDPRRRATNQQG